MSYDYVAKMLEADTPMYLEPHRFTTRASEVSREKSGKEIVLDNVNLTVKDVVPKDKCQISNELQLHQAFTRRALACDLMQACTFKDMERWHRHLLDQMQSPAPPGFRPPNMEQVLRTDRAAWVRMAEQVTTLKRSPDGSLPLDKALEELRSDPSVMFHLIPMPAGKQPGPAKASADKVDDPSTKNVPIKKKEKIKAKGKGKGGNGKPSSKGKMPAELIGLHQQDKSGRRMCYNYNLAKGCDLAGAGQTCSKGVRICMKCFGAHPAHQCNASMQ